MIQLPLLPESLPNPTEDYANIVFIWQKLVSAINRNAIMIVKTASLPPGAASMDGTVIIEDGGAGNGNLIIYVGGSRYRIDGGSPF